MSATPLLFWPHSNLWAQSSQSLKPLESGLWCWLRNPTVEHKWSDIITAVPKQPLHSCQAHRGKAVQQKQGWMLPLKRGLAGQQLLWRVQLRPRRLTTSWRTGQEGWETWEEGGETCCVLGDQGGWGWSTNCHGNAGWGGLNCSWSCRRDTVSRHECWICWWDCGGQGRADLHRAQTLCLKG